MAPGEKSTANSVRADDAHRHKTCIYFLHFLFMKATTPLSVLTALALMAGSIPAAFAVNSIYDSTDSSDSSSSSSWSSSSSSNSSWNSSDYWTTQSSSQSSYWLMQHPDCLGMTGDPLDACLQQLGVFPSSPNGTSWLPTNTTWLSSMPNLHCETYTSADRAACEQQMLTNWIAAYRALHAWVDQMDQHMQDMMRANGLSDMQITDISAGLTTSTSINNTGTYSNTATMRDAWKVCQQFDGRTQARCMRDALTSNSGFDNRFRNWTELDDELNGNN